MRTNNDVLRDDDDDDDDERRFYITYWRLGFFGKKAADERGGDTCKNHFIFLSYDTEQKFLYVWVCMKRLIGHDSTIICMYRSAYTIIVTEFD